MTHDEAFLQAILESPDDDTPRLVYADWLDENGDSDRAEFIRVQCRYHRKQKDTVIKLGDPDGKLLHELERAHSQRWLQALPVWPGIRWWSFWRGFPGIQATSWSALRRHARQIWSLAPVEYLHFYHLSPSAGQGLARSSYLARIRVLELDWVGVGGLPGLDALLGSRHLVHLRCLNLKSCGIGDAGVRAIADSPNLTGLETLVLECNEITDTGAFALARSPHLPRTGCRVWADRNPIGNKAAAALKKRFSGRAGRRSKGGPAHD
jgi:uncharacterized protein (TIGR02996 family)